MQDSKKPECFANINIVFPLTENGFRESPETCMYACPHKTECLRIAMSCGPVAAKAREEKVDKAFDSGMINFFERWSRKKYLNKKGSQTH